MAKVVTAVELKLTGAEQANESVGSFKQRLREANNELLAMSEKFGATSKEAVTAAQKVAGLKDAIGDAKILADGFNPDAKFRAFSNALQGVVGGFAGVQGAMGLFGAESKDLEKVLLKVQSAMALSQGLNAVLEAKDAFIALGTVIKTQVVTAFSTLKGALIATGIGALVVTLGILISTMDAFSGSTETAAEAQDKLREATDKLNKAVSEEIEIVDSINEANIKRAKIAGKGENDIYEMQKAAVQARIDLRNREIDNALKSGQSITELTKANSKDLTELQNLDLDRQIASADKARDAAQKAYEKRLDDEKKFREKMQRFREDFDKWNYQRAVDERDVLAADTEAMLKADEEAIAKDEAAKQAKLEREALYFRQLNELFEQHRAEQAAQEQALFETRQSYAQATANGLSALSGLVGEQTAAGKALAVAAATIDTYAAIAATLRNAAKTPAGGIPGFAIAQAVATGLFGLAQVKKILSTKVPGKSSGGSAPIISGTISPIQPQAQLTRLDQNSINAVGNAASRAYVLETDVSNNQERVRRLNRAARIN